MGGVQEEVGGREKACAEMGERAGASQGITQGEVSGRGRKATHGWG